MSETAAVATDRPIGQLADVYAAIAEWFLYPEEVDPESLGEVTIRAAEEQCARIDPRAAEHLRAFHEARRTVGPEEYLNLLELNPRCPLYMGSYQFPEPTSCSNAGLSERNQYMLEVGNVYRHFGYEIVGELPDYLPAMVEFLAMSAGTIEERIEGGIEGRGDEDEELRLRFIEKLVLPGVEQFVEKLEAEGGPYSHLAQALLACLGHEVGSDRESSPVSAQAGERLNLIQIAEANGGGEPR